MPSSTKLTASCSLRRAVVLGSSSRRCTGSERGILQDRADGRPLMAVMQAGRPLSVGVCRPSAAWRSMLLEPCAFDWLLQLLEAFRGPMWLPGLSAAAAKCRQLLVRCQAGRCGAAWAALQAQPYLE